MRAGVWAGLAATLGGQAQPQLLQAARQAGVLIKDRHLRHWVALGDIVSVQAQDDYICLHLSDGHTLLKIQSLSEFEQELSALSPCVVRMRRSWLLHLEHFRGEVRRPGASPSALMSTASEVPVSRSGLERLQQAAQGVHR